jgi:inositol transport system substrate-binding protein
VLARKHEYGGGIIVIPVLDCDKHDDVSRFATQLGIPVVLVDQNPAPRQKIPENVSYACVSDVEGGAMAGVAAVDLARTVPMGKVLVVADHAKPARFHSFVQVLTQRVDCKVQISCDGGFNRGRAAQVVHDHLVEALKVGPSFDVVFNISDSMTLGTLDACRDLGEHRGFLPPYVIGYDGISATRALVQSGEIARVVVQEAKALACASVEELAWRLSGRRASGNVVWVPPTLCRPGMKADRLASEAEPEVDDYVREEVDFALRQIAAMIEANAGRQSIAKAKGRLRKLVLTATNKSGKRSSAP